MNIYNEIYNFCKVEETETTSNNRFIFLINLLKKYNIDYNVIKGYKNDIEFKNIFIKGKSNKFLSAHYDIINKKSNNANDNSASIINAIAYNLKNPSINVLLLDGEEPPYFGSGSTIMSEYFKKNNIKVEWILNLELTGFGKDFFIDKYKTKLSNHLYNLYKDKLIKIDTPFNDSTIFRNNGFNSNVLTTFDMINEKIDTSHLLNCHSINDSLSTIKIEDMKYFVKHTLNKICK